MTSTEDEAPVLEDMTKTELQEHADSLDVEYSDSDTKAELIDAINEAQGTTSESTNGGDAEAEPEALLAYGSEQYPERRPIEVDIKDVPVEEYEGETMPPLNAESWVILDGDHELVPDEFDGAVAAVIDSPTVTDTNPDTGESVTHFPSEGRVTVRERSQGATFNLPLDAFKEIYTNGRPSVLGFA